MLSGQADLPLPVEGQGSTLASGLTFIGGGPGFDPGRRTYHNTGGGPGFDPGKRTYHYTGGGPGFDPGKQTYHYTGGGPGFDPGKQTYHYRWRARVRPWQTDLPLPVEGHGSTLASGLTIILVEGQG